MPPASAWHRVSRRAAVTVAAMVAFSLWVGLAFYGRWRLFLLGYDFAYFTQAGHLISRFDTTFVSFAGVHLLGDHAELTFFPVALGARVVPATVWLPTVQIGALAVAAVPLSLLARRGGLGPAWTGVAIGAVLLHPAVQNLAINDYHPETLAVPLYLFAFWAALERRWAVYGACTALALLTKEDQAAVVLMLALWVALFRRERRVALLTALGAVVWGVLATKFLIPHSSAAGVYYRGNIFANYGTDIFSALRTMATHPLRVARDLGHRPNLDLLVALLGPVAFLPLLEWAALIPAGLILLGNMLAATPAPHTINNQYQAAVLPFLAAATVLGLARLVRAVGDGSAPMAGPVRPSRVPMRRLVALPLIGASLLGWAQLSGATPKVALGSTPPEQAASASALARVGPDDGVSTFDRLAARLGRREVLYAFPAPFRGVPSVPRLRAGDSERVDWVLLDATDARSGQEDVADTLQAVRACGFAFEGRAADVWVYHRTSRPAPCPSG